MEIFEGAREAERIAREGALTSAHLPGFSLALAELFAALDR